jgi:hypothetical protein
MHLFSYISHILSPVLTHLVLDERTTTFFLKTHSFNHAQTNTTVIMNTSMGTIMMMMTIAVVAAKKKRPMLTCRNGRSRPWPAETMTPRRLRSAEIGRRSRRLTPPRRLRKKWKNVEKGIKLLVYKEWYYYYNEASARGALLKRLLEISLLEIIAVFVLLFVLLSC